MSDFDDVRDAAEAAAVIGKLDVAAELVDRYRMGLLGSFWLDAEGIPTEWDQLSDEAQDAIIERIRRQEAASPGDLAVRAVRLSHKLRRLDEAPSWLLKRFMQGVEDERKIRVNELRRFHYYDSMEFGGVTGDFQQIRLFGNANVGNLERTNIQVAGQLSYCDTGSFATHFYLTALPPLETLYGIVEFIIGDRRAGIGLAHQLLVRPQPLDVFIPPRERVEARFEIGYTRRFKKEDPRPPDGTLVYVHVEGYSVVALR